jgi:hypothetical protein
MPRKKKQDVKVNDNESLEGLMQETYNDACLQINDAQKGINELVTSTTPNDVDEVTKVAREKANLLKIKDSGIKIKLELAKLQSDIIKSRGDVESALATRSQGSASLEDFKSIRAMLKNQANGEPDTEPTNDTETLF